MRFFLGEDVHHPGGQMDILAFNETSLAWTAAGQWLKQLIACQSVICCWQSLFACRRAGISWFLWAMVLVRRPDKFTQHKPPHKEGIRMPYVKVFWGVFFALLSSQKRWTLCFIDDSTCRLQHLELRPLKESETLHLQTALICSRTYFTPQI